MMLEVDAYPIFGKNLIILYYFYHTSVCKATHHCDSRAVASVKEAHGHQFTVRTTNRKWPVGN